jgi:hypothetical protein
MIGVMLASRREGGAKFLQRTLDRRHAIAIKQFARLKDEPAVRAEWSRAVECGDIPGPYWAVLTHPAASSATVKKAFGDVHMLSHMVGAANRADIRRLRQLEKENATLAARLERQQVQLRDGFRERDAAIRHLTDVLSQRMADVATREQAADRPVDGAVQVIGDLNARLSREIARRERAEQRAQNAAEAAREKAQSLRSLDRENAALRRELAVIEADMLAGAGDGTPDEATPADLTATTILYVGGRACRQYGKRYAPPRTSSLASLLAALSIEDADRG